MEYCGIELTEEGLQHYGVKGMHWGIRRYQPYPGQADGRKLSRRQVRKTMRAIKRNSKRYAQRNWYANRSLDESLQNANKAADARAQGYNARAEKFDKKAKKQATDTAKHLAGMADLKKEINSAVNKIESTGEYKVMADKGRTFLSGSGRYLTGWALAGIPGMIGVAAYRTVSGKPIDGKINYKKPTLRNTNGQKESGDFVDPTIKITPKSKSESSMDGFMDSRMMNKAAKIAANREGVSPEYIKEAARANVAPAQKLFKDYGFKTPRDIEAESRRKRQNDNEFTEAEKDRIRAATPPSKFGIKQTPVTIKPKATSLRTKDGKINTMHPAVNYAIESYSKKSGMSKKQVSDWVRKEGEPPNHDDWDQVIDEYNKKKKR